MKTIYEIIYDVDQDTEEKINEFDDLDEFRDEQANRTEAIATFDSKEAAEEYMKQMKITYDLMQETGDELHYDVYNPAACEIHEQEILDLKDAQEAFKEDIEKLKGNKKEAR